MKSVTLISSGERVSCLIVGKVTLVIIILYFNLNPSYMACTVYVYFSILNDDNFFFNFYLWTKNLLSDPFMYNPHVLAGYWF